MSNGNMDATQCNPLYNSEKSDNSKLDDLDEGYYYDPNYPHITTTFNL